MADQLGLARDWRTRRADRETTIVTVGTGSGGSSGTALTVMLAADGSVRVEHRMDGATAFVRATQDGPAGYRSEVRHGVPPYNAVALLSDEEKTDG